MMKNSNHTIRESWSHKVEEFVDKGKVSNAISLLGSVISSLETLESDSASDSLHLAAAICDLAELESSRGFSYRADELRSKVYVLKNRGVDGFNLEDIRGLESLENAKGEEAGNSKISNGNQEEEEEDDWEAIADHPILGYASASTVSSTLRTTNLSQSLTSHHSIKLPNLYFLLALFSPSLSRSHWVSIVL